MALFPMTNAGAAFTLDGPQTVDQYFQGIRTKADFSAAFATLSEGVEYSNGLRLLASGQLSIVDASSGLPASATFVNGLPITSDGKLCVSKNAIATWSNGIAFDAAGAVVFNPFAGASLDLNFAEATALDSRITFTRASTAMFFNSSGVLTSAANDVPRLDHDPVTFQPRGLLIEEQRTNLLVRSAEFGNASWTKQSSVSVAPNVETAPDGTLTASRITADSGFGLFQSVSVTVGASITQSVYLKAGTATRIMFRDFNAGRHIVVNPATGAIVETAGTLLGSGSINCGNGWFRVFFSYTANVAAVVGTIRPDSSGAGQTCILWGAQIEVGAFPTSYIPTTTAAATRSADVAVMTGTNFSSWYRQDEGSVYAEVSTPQLVSAARYFQMDDGTDSVFMGTGITSTQVRFRGTAGGGTDQYDLATGVVAANAVVKAAGGFKVNDFALSVNGGAATTDTLGTLCTPNTMRIGQALAGSQLNGHIRRITYYPRRLSNAELQWITS